MSFDNVSFSLASSVAVNGTVVVSYPDDRSQGSYDWSPGKHVLYVAGNKFTAPEDFTLTFNANSAGITVTNKAAGAWASGSACRLQIDRPGEDSDSVAPINRDKSKILPVELHLINLGSPETADANGYVESQDVTSAGVFSVDGTAAAAIAAAALGGEADVPRNVVAAWSTSAAITVTGTDEYGNVMVETATSATSFTGKKAFKTVTDVSFDVNVTGVTVGTGVLIGLPEAVTKSGQVLAVLQDGAPVATPTALTVTALSAISAANATLELVPETSATNAAAEINRNFKDLAAAITELQQFTGLIGSTFVAAVGTEASGTTGDVRGTISPPATPDGDKGFQLLVAQHTPNNKGVAQYGG